MYYVKISINRLSLNTQRDKILLTSNNQCYLYFMLQNKIMLHIYKIRMIKYFAVFF